MQAFQTPPSSIDTLIKAISHRVEAQGSSELNKIYETYANEARFGRLWLDQELRQLETGSAILEIGAGMFLLACQLKREGFHVTALEPTGSGYAHFARLQEVVINYAKENDILPDILSYSAEELKYEKVFTFAYSLNVMEHVSDVKTTLEHIWVSLRHNGIYRFVCPNYSFPYETHFAIPIIGNKALTMRMLKNKIINATHMDDPSGVWQSLNWITVKQIKSLCRHLGYPCMFNAGIMRFYMDRALNDISFCTRHPIIHYIISTLNSVGMLALIKLFPIQFLPVMDCRITRTEG